MVAYADTGRSRCRECNAKIKPGALRIGYDWWMESRGRNVIAWKHVACYYKDVDMRKKPLPTGMELLEEADRSQVKSLHLKQPLLNPRRAREERERRLAKGEAALLKANAKLKRQRSELESQQAEVEAEAEARTAAMDKRERALKKRERALAKD